MNPPIATAEEMIIGAEVVKSFYDSYLKAGFTKKEAMELTKALLIANVKK